jgi:Kdo2-lipid IVA lauroyltransferase/acyltransferase
LARPLQKLKNHLIYYSVLFLLFFLDRLPYALLKRLGRVFGTLVFELARGERRKTLIHLRLAYPTGMTESQRRSLARKVWENVGENMFEIVRWRKWVPERIVSQLENLSGMEHMTRALARGKGVIATTAHLGNWELLPGVFARRFPGRVMVVARQVYDPRFDRMVTELRERLGSRVVQRGTAIRGILRALKQNHVVGLLCDQDTGGDGVFVPFFGIPAWTQSGPARIARKTGACVIPVFIIRNIRGRFDVHILKEIKVPRTSDEEADVLETVRRYTEAIETFVRAHPDQWVWMHERWKTRPKNGTG